MSLNTAKPTERQKSLTILADNLAMQSVSQQFKFLWKSTDLHQLGITDQCRLTAIVAKTIFIMLDKWDISLSLCSSVKDNLVGQVLWNWWVFSRIVWCFFLHLQGDLLNWPLCRLYHHKKSLNPHFFKNKINIVFQKNWAWPVNLVKLTWTSRSQYLFENNFFSFTSNLAKFQWKDIFKWLS